MLALAPGHASAQAVVQPDAATDGQMPGVSLGAAFGATILSALQGQGAPTWGGSVQLGLARRIVVEGQISRWSGRDTSIELSADDASRIIGQPVVFPSLLLIAADRRHATVVSSSIFMRAGTPKVVGFAGGGVTIERTADRLFGRLEACGSGFCITPGPAPTVIRRTRAGAHIAGGADFALARRVWATAALRWQLGPEAALDVTGGIRVALTSREWRAAAGTRSERVPGSPTPAAGSLAPHQGREVRVISPAGTRQTGRLTAVAGDGITLITGRQTLVLPFRDIRRIENEPHHARHLGLIGAIGGFFVGWLGFCDSGDEQGCYPEGGLILAGIAGGAGLGIGAMLNSAHRRVLWAAPPPAGLELRPVISARRAGMSVLMRW